MHFYSFYLFTYQPRQLTCAFGQSAIWIFFGDMIPRVVTAHPALVFREVVSRQIITCTTDTVIFGELNVQIEVSFHRLIDWLVDIFLID